MQTKQQKRAEFALEQIANFGTPVPSKSVSFIVSTPTMLLMNGLGQTLAFLLSRGIDGNEGKVFNIIKEWLIKEQFVPEAHNLEFLKKFNSLDQAEYLKAQHETLKLLEWLKRYARAFQAIEGKN
ncbi:crispr-associated protein, Cmr5 family [Leadbettera azotonutricia ZAS-9]|uniref:CRISPR type III-B/RAMP module-associated protein Cmr5 n=2 Tax=Leadbettera azotonutricia TaxID=150829 RepID=F5YCJ3_LEAAZ|nr:crispr-associated protein, Cmr5 family [Leadbettera azotonutricia ZAS-9]